MKRTLASLILLLALHFEGTAQIPTNKKAIQSFIDSIGNSQDRQLISSSMFPAVANGTNFIWKQNIWRNRKKKLLWVESIIRDSISTVFFYCQDSLIFAGERTYAIDTITNKRKSLFRNIFFYRSQIIDDSAPGRNSNKVEYYLEKSRRYRELAKELN